MRLKQSEQTGGSRRSCLFGVGSWLREKQLGFVSLRAGVGVVPPRKSKQLDGGGKRSVGEAGLPTRAPELRVDAPPERGLADLLRWRHQGEHISAPPPRLLRIWSRAIGVLILLEEIQGAISVTFFSLGVCVCVCVCSTY